MSVKVLDQRRVQQLVVGYCRWDAPMWKRRRGITHEFINIQFIMQFTDSVVLVSKTFVCSFINSFFLLVICLFKSSLICLFICLFVQMLILLFIRSLLNRVSIGGHLNRVCPRICPQRWLAGCSSLHRCPGIPQEVEAFGAGNQSCASLWPPVRVYWYCHQRYTAVF